MRKASPELSLRSYQEGIDAVLDLLSKVVSCDRLTFSAADKRELAEALVFKVTAEWEVLVEELFVDLMNKDNSQYAETIGVSLPKHQTRDQCQAMLIGTGYFDFKNCGDLKGLAKNYLVTNLNPFRALSASTSQKVDELFVIRNYLGHYSIRAEKKLANMYRNRYGMQRVSEPGRFLLARTRGNRIRFQDFLDAFVTAPRELAAPLGITL